ncbi:hypothetical protein FLK61_34510 [Paenalkalicoccus suaedae]|uniref:Intracellular proteinase inhibitor BsuPI domain-containing protein n=1 Tax=Paenalkalicoccus suaedae TaxID=2592382 RepID=A0A859FFA7_9BACI|nr:BsuPI-related putative proteinase inhibitor [Paenalkalicoccus suaedae]QKS71787.1 hypothetical protein FLK61_34510 [Paenalkalicoccus suaedae]
MIRLVMLIGLLLFLVACGQGENNNNDATNVSDDTNTSNEPADDMNNDNATSGNEEASDVDVQDSVVEHGLSFEAEVTESGGLYTVTAELQNVSDDDKEVMFTSGHQFDLSVNSTDGQELYNWAADKMFTQAISYETIAPGDSLTFEETWQPTVEAEGYIFTVGILAAEVDGQATDGSYRVELTVE